jgi:hypothetical protein
MSDPACPFGRGVGVLEVLLFPEQAENVTRTANKSAGSFRENERSGLFLRKTVFMGTHPHFVTVDCCFGSFLAGSWKRSFLDQFPKIYLQY